MLSFVELSSTLDTLLMDKGGVLQAMLLSMCIVCGGSVRSLIEGGC